jgi:Putative Actinobacterial Holin-X, holin superfamily III
MANSDFDPGGGYPRGQSIGQKSMAELTGDLAHQMTSLVHHEIELAKAEMSEKGKRAGLGAGMFGAGGLLAAFGFGCVTACFVAALQLGMAVWLAALIVGLVYMAGAGLLVLLGRRQISRATPPVPAEAVESTKEDVEWLKTQAQSARQ